MTNNHFLVYLDQVATPERKLVFQEAIETLTAAGIRGHEFQIDEMMELDDLGDNAEFLLQIEATLSTIYHGILQQFGVTLDDACDLAMATDILKALLAMDNWSDPASLSDACESQESSEAILAELLELTGNKHAGDYLPHLVRVSSDLIQRIDDANHLYPESALPSSEEHTRAVDRLTAFFARYSAPILSQAISEMLLLGADYKALMEPYQEKVSNLELEAAVNELVGFALASDLPNGEELIKAIHDESQGWWDGQTSTATKATALVKERLKEAHAL